MPLWTGFGLGALIVLSIVLLVIDALLPDDSPLSTLLETADRAVLTIFAVEILLGAATSQLPTLSAWMDMPLN